MVRLIGTDDGPSRVEDVPFDREGTGKIHDGDVLCGTVGEANEKTE